MNILSEIRQRFEQVLTKLVPDGNAPLELIQPSQNVAFGDYQANVAMPLGKKLGKPPREIADQIVVALDIGDLSEPPEIAGPGFINLRMRNQWLEQQLEAARRDPRLGVAPTAAPRKFVVDFSSPNVAKPMHVGHIRSTVIGDALCRTLRFAGHEVISDNHLGDWGTQFGMIIYGYKHFRDEAAYQSKPIEELGRLYRHVRQVMDVCGIENELPQLTNQIAAKQQQIAGITVQLEGLKDKQRKKKNKELKKAEADLASLQKLEAAKQSRLAEAQADPTWSQLLQDHANIASAVLEETAKLHEGDEDTRGLWQEFLPACKADIDNIYRRLDIAFDHELGESFYHDRLHDVVSSFETAGLAKESEGAMCVFLDGFDSPMIIRKQDGAFLYATTDLATIEYRARQWNPDEVLYVVDFRQGEHFKKLFAAAKLWGYEKPKLVHVEFGTVLGDDGKPFKTRSGDTVGLAGLLDEAERRALAVVTENDETKPAEERLSEAERSEVARTVGIAALKYADLSQNRASDYVFSYDKMLGLTGNTATYMQYSYARVQGIFHRGDVDVEQLRNSDAQIRLVQDAERALGLQLLRYSEAIDQVIEDYRPNHLTNYLFELAKTFSAFFENCPVLKAEDAASRNSRLLLCDLTARTLKSGLGLLGIQVVNRM